MSKDDVLVQIILPPREQDELSNGLRNLTGVISKANPDLDNSYGLGGPDGYGCDYENDIFAMRRFYWGDCDCGAEEGADDEPHKPTCSLLLPNFVYKPTGFQCRWYKWIGRDNECSGAAPDIAQMIENCIASVNASATKV